MAARETRETRGATRWFRVHNRWALGDTVLLGGLARDLHLSTGGRCRLAVTGHFSSFWNFHPYGRHQPPPGTGVTHVDLQYRNGILASKAREFSGHFYKWLCDDFSRKSGVRVWPHFARGEVAVDPAAAEPLVGGDYWLAVAGWKSDMPAKAWGADRWQRAVDLLRQEGVHVVQAGSVATDHVQPRLSGVLDAVGRTEDIAKFFRLVRDCRGVVCGVTAAMHLAAAFEKPCVVLAGGREGRDWECYEDGAFGKKCAPVAVPHRFLDTLGRLSCCTRVNGCWKDLLKRPKGHAVRRPPHQGKPADKVCLKVVEAADGPRPECMEMIEPERVVEAVLSYGTPRGGPPPEFSPAFAAREPRPRPEAARPARPAKSPRAAADAAAVGGKFTACVLCHGDYPDLARRCVGSILRHSARGQVDLRVALNQCCAETKDYVFSLGDRVTKVYADDGDRRKYPAMREMFHDPDCPVTTGYVLWFDDDSHVVDPNWLTLLSRCIVENHPRGARLYGVKYYHDLAKLAKSSAKNPVQWFRAARWWRGRHLFLGYTGKTAANGSVIEFASGGFVAIGMDAVRAAGIPDERLNHNGGDITLGAMVHQAGYRMQDFCRGKTPVCYSDHARRGYQERFPWDR